MTQNETDIIKKAILDSTEAYVEAKLAMSDFVKTQIGVIDSYVKRNGKYYHTVKCDNGRVTYNNVLSIGNIPFPLNSTVFLISPNAQFSNQFILGRLGDTPSSTIGGSINIGNGVFVVESNGNMISQSGTVSGSFDGYIESANGIIGGIGYADNIFYGSPVIKDSTTNGTINIRTNGTKPTIVRTYTEGGITHTDEIAWEYDASGKQNFINQSSTAPTAGSGENGDLQFKGTNGNGQKKLYRNDNGTWTKIDFIEFGTTDPSGGEDGDIYFQNDGSQITKIWQKINGSWIFFASSSGNPPTVGVSNMLGNTSVTTDSNTSVSNVLGNTSISMTPHITISNA